MKDSFWVNQTAEPCNEALFYQELAQRPYFCEILLSEPSSRIARLMAGWKIFP